MKRWIPVGIASAAGIVATTVAYLPALDAGFYFDDLINFVDVPSLHWQSLSASEMAEALEATLLPRRWLANLSLGLNYYFGRLNPVGYHAVNLAIHLAVGAVVAWTACLLASKGSRQPDADRAAPLAAVVGAVLFLVHPLNTQAVTYVVQRMASMAALFGILAIALYVRARRDKRRGWCGALLAGAGLSWILALGSKENAAIVPIVILAYEWSFYRAEWGARIRSLIDGRRGKVYALLIIVAFAALATGFVKGYASDMRLSMVETYPGRDFSGLERVMTQGRVHLFYTGLLFWPQPSRLGLEHDFRVSRSLLDPPETLLAVALWLAAVGLAIELARRRPRYGFPLLAYFLLHSLESGPLNLELVFEHRMYFPMTALSVLVTVLIVDLPRTRRWMAIAGVALLAVPLAMATYQRNLVWVDPVVFHRDCVAKAPGKPRPRNNLGSALYEAGDIEGSAEAFQTALVLDPDYTKATIGLAKSYAALGEHAAARAILAATAEKNPGSPTPHIEIGNVLLQEGDLPGAALEYEAALRLNPEHVGANYNLGTTYLKLGRSAQAIPYLERVRVLDPSFDRVLRPLGDAYAAMGRDDEAIELYRAALRRSPSDGLLHLALGTLLGSSGDVESALGHLEKAVALAPDHSEAHNNLANALMFTGEIGRAIEHYRTSVELDPRNARAHYNLAAAYRRSGRLEEAEQHRRIAEELLQE